MATRNSVIISIALRGSFTSSGRASHEGAFLGGRVSNAGACKLIPGLCPRTRDGRD